jgi:hypothetical protein
MITKEYILLIYLLNKYNYNNYNKYINYNYIRKEYIDLYKIYISLQQLWEVVPPEKEQLSLQEVRIFFESCYPALSQSEKAGIDLLFDTLANIQLDASVVDSIIQTHREQAQANELASLAYEVSVGKADYTSFRERFLDYEKTAPILVSENPFVENGLDELYSDTYNKPGVKFPIITLRKMLGSLRQGDFGFIFTRPEVGKTTFLAHIGSYFASQIERPLLHFNNEEEGRKIQIRYYQAALGVTVNQLFSNRKANEEAYRNYTKDNIKIYDSAALSKHEIEDICEKFNPAVIFIDSIDKVKGFADDRDDLVYKAIYQWARELAKCYGPVIGACHASVSAEGKKWLEMDDVAYAKTAKQGEADWILGIGQSHDIGTESVRHLHLCKNKLLGDSDMVESFRHGRFDVRIYPEIAQYGDVVEFDE